MGRAPGSACPPFSRRSIQTSRQVFQISPTGASVRLGDRKTLPPLLFEIMQTPKFSRQSKTFVSHVLPPYRPRPRNGQAAAAADISGHFTALRTLSFRTAAGGQVHICCHGFDPCAAGFGRHRHLRCSMLLGVLFDERKWRWAQSVKCPLDERVARHFRSASMAFASTWHVKRSFIDAWHQGYFQDD